MMRPNITNTKSTCNCCKKAILFGFFSVWIFPPPHNSSTFKNLQHNHGFFIAPLPFQNGGAAQNNPTLLRQPNSEMAVSLPSNVAAQSGIMETSINPFISKP